MHEYATLARAALRRGARCTWPRSQDILLRALAALTVFAAVMLGMTSTSHAAAKGPCDIYGTAGTPCVAAHSTTRALYTNYSGPLYQIARSSDQSVLDIGLNKMGGYADSGPQDKFCKNTYCVITKIYDQSPQHNDLTIEGAGGNGRADIGAPANALPVMIGTHKVYGVLISAGMGYRNDATTGIATNGQPEGMYMVTSGTHVNDQCCFDYGNVEVSNNDTGNGHMDAINFGTECWFNPCNGPGPWLQADLENGLFQSGDGPSQNPANTGNPQPYVTALLKNNGQNYFALKTGDATSGSLVTNYAGGLPSKVGGYQPMQQEGAIVLGTGGDNSNGSIGSFFEGVMTAGMPSDAADDAVQANIVKAAYGAPTGISGYVTPGAEISLQATTPCCTTDYWSHNGSTAYPGGAIANMQVVTSSSSTSAQQDATWIVRQGLAKASCVSFESKDSPGEFLRQFGYQVYVQPYDGTFQFAADATYCQVPGNNGSGASFQSYNFPGFYIRHYGYILYVARNGGSNPWDNPNSFADDTSFLVDMPWGP